MFILATATQEEMATMTAVFRDAFVFTLDGVTKPKTKQLKNKNKRFFLQLYLQNKQYIVFEQKKKEKKIYIYIYFFFF